MRLVLGTLICTLALLLPCRLRILLCEVLGWIFQAAYWGVYRLVRFVVRSLQ